MSTDRAPRNADPPPAYPGERLAAEAFGAKASRVARLASAKAGARGLGQSVEDSAVVSRDHNDGASSHGTSGVSAGLSGPTRPTHCILIRA